MTQLPSPVDIRPGVWCWPSDTATARIVWQWDRSDLSLRIVKANYHGHEPVFSASSLASAMTFAARFEAGVQRMLPKE
jgi:hypothetical protein